MMTEAVEMAKVTKQKSQPSLYERAVVYILNMPKTEKQMRQWYARKTADQAVIEQDIERLKEYKLIDDAEYARMYVEVKKEKMGVGMLRNKLRVNGVSADVVEKAVSVVDNQFDFAYKCVEKYMRSKDKTPENKSKLFRWLLSKGIVYDLCVEVIDEYWH